MKYGTLRFRAEPDANTVGGFTEMLALAAGGELSDEQRAALDDVPDRSIAAGLTDSSTDPDEDPVVETDEEGDAEEDVTPDADAAAPAEQGPTFEAGYAKALGEMSERLGAERAQREALEARLAKLEAPEEEGEPEFFIPTEEDIEEMEDQLSTLGGPQFITQIGNSSPEKIDAAMAVWKSQGDPNAWIFEANANRIFAKNAPKEEPAAPALDPTLQRLAQREKAKEMFNSFATELGQDEAKRVFPHLDAALKDAGPLQRKAIGEALASDDAKEQKLGFDELVGLAKLKAATAKETTQRKEDVKASKTAARVATGSQRVAAPGQSDLPTSKEELEKLPDAERKRVATLLVAREFKKTESTSVQDGLTGL